MTRILVTGSRIWNDEDLVLRTLADIDVEYGKPITLVHGEARGLDVMAADIANRIGWQVEGHGISNEDWIKYGKEAGPRRNQAMVDSGADACLGFPLVLQSWSGTLDCMTRADEAGIPVFCNGEQWNAEQWMKDRMVRFD